MKYGKEMLQGNMARIFFKELWQENVARKSGNKNLKGNLAGKIVRIYGKKILQGNMARKFCYELLQENLARKYGRKMSQGNLKRKFCKEI